ncbi:MAG: delta-aminolevulinic acid dehydratase, partial [Myxococcota bacterium]|nr:delta-aminolevulinic acid dehydratase [Myxococcota bacterium]
MASALIESRIRSLRAYCEAENFEGWDPYDGLNSPIIQKTPLRRLPLARLAWIQLFKRSPINLRPFTGVAKGANPKGLGLFLTTYCNLARVGDKQAETQVEPLAERIL